MLINNCDLSYCTNIYPGNSWEDDFLALKQHFPIIKQQTSPNSPMAIGLRISNESSKALINDAELNEFKKWLMVSGGYITTINGFPYGNFHHLKVKDDVHSPDWSTEMRKNYTLRLFKILSSLIPHNLEGGVSTSPLSYKYWFINNEAYLKTKKRATENIAEVVIDLIKMSSTTGKVLHLDIEPEPDGMIETGSEFLEWFENYLQPIAVPKIMEKCGATYNAANILLKDHLRLCLDICHFAISYEDHADIIEKLIAKGIKIGRIQVSSAIKIKLPAIISKRKKIIKAIEQFDESTYLHQVIAHTVNGPLLRYRDLPYAIKDYTNPVVNEWRAHFHVPVSEALDGDICSTQEDIIEVLRLNKKYELTNHLEVETYTWEVLPDRLKIPIADSICKELHWVVDLLGTIN